MQHTIVKQDLNGVCLEKTGESGKTKMSGCALIYVGKSVLVDNGFHLICLKSNCSIMQVCIPSLKSYKFDEYSCIKVCIYR